MPAKPSTLPVWATTGGTTLTPSGGQQAAGFAVNTKPPARWTNWLFNLIYQWIQYINAPVGTGPNGDGLAATGVGTGAGLRGTGDANSATAPGVAGAGGGLGGPGVSGTGGGAGDGVVGQGGGTTGVGVRGTGGTNTAGVVGTGGATAGDGVQGTGTGGGRGVVGTGQGSGAGGQFNGGATGNGVQGIGGATSGYGVIAQADTTTPVNSAFRMVPQDADPSSPLAGDEYVRVPVGGSTAAKPRLYNGTTWDRHVMQSFSSTPAGGGDSRATTGNFATSYSIPANTLRAGSTVRIRAFGQMTAFTSGAASVQLVVGGATIATTNAPTPGASDKWFIDCEIVVSADPGASVRCDSAALGHFGADTLATHVDSRLAVRSNNLATNGAIVVQPACTLGGTETIELRGLIVDVL